MAKIDVSAIEGYDAMTPEQKVAALEGFELAPSNQDEISRLKDAVNRATSEAADYKRQLRAKQSDEEARAAQEAETRAQMEQELNALRAEREISSYLASYLSLGYDEGMARATAEALHKRDFNTVFDNQRKQLEAVRKAAVAEALRGQPDLTHGDPVNTETAEAMQTEQLRRAMGLPTRQKKG